MTSAAGQTGVGDALSRVPRPKGVLQASLVTRDGLRVASVGSQPGSAEVFSAMTAALMAASETAFHELGDANGMRVNATTAKQQMLVVGAGAEILLVVISQASSAQQSADYAVAVLKELGSPDAHG